MVVAHELAHNLGSDHDGVGANELCPSSTYIMSPIINPAFNLNNFSACSKADIESTLSKLAEAQLCLDFHADTYIIENPDNSGVLDGNLEFLSSYTANLQNGFVPLDRIDLNSTVNLAQGMFVNVTANGNNCNIAADGSSYTCMVTNPPSNFQIVLNIKTVSSTLNVSISQTISEQTADVQDVNVANNTLISIFSISDGDVTSNTQTTAPPSTNNNSDVTNEENAEEGGAGSLSYVFILMMTLLWCMKRFLIIRIVY